jgi:pimeloyl-ACP methyl ester carboxylesterase
VIALLHGFLDDATVWDGVAERLDEPTLRVELAGFGARAGEPGPYTLARHTDDLVAALAAGADGGPLVLVGQSMGAQVAELAAVRLNAAVPGRVRALVLVTPVPLAGTGLPEDETVPFQCLGGDVAAQRELRAALGGGLTDGQLDRLTRAGEPVRREVTVETVRAWNGGDPAGRAPSGFTGPVLVVWGGADPLVTGELLDQGVTPRFAAARVVVVPDAGHWVHAQRPHEVAALITEFVAAPTGDGAGNSWRTAFRNKDSADFAAAFAPDVTLRASTLAAPVHGAERVAAVMGAASGIYESLEFVHRAEAGTRTYLEWTATAFGGVVLDGVTVLVTGADGRIRDIAIHHRPLGAALSFSVELGARLRDSPAGIDPALFHPDHPPSTDRENPASTDRENPGSTD